MRPQRTPDEDQAISAVVAHLRASELHVNIDESITDRPDAVLVVNGERVALECRTFTPEKLIKEYKKDLVPDRNYQIFLPIEPHSWLGRAISEKNQKIDAYKLNGRASEAWLVVHSVRGPFSCLSEHFKPGLSALFFMSVFQTPHAFSRIYLSLGDEEPAICLYRADAQEERAMYEHKVVLSTPVLRYTVSRRKPKLMPDGTFSIVGNVFSEDEELVLLQPLDKSLRVDYEPLKSMPATEVARRTWELHANRIST